MSRVLLVLLLAGCVPMPDPVDRADALGARPPSSDRPTYAEGLADGFVAGKQALRARLAGDPAFHVSHYVLSVPDDRASWLPRTGEITPIQFWRSRQRNLWTLDQCVANATAKRAAIMRMLDTLRDPSG